MKRLWAPWRKAYIRPESKPNLKGCLFCRVLQEKNDEENLILVRHSSCYAILNLYPYNNGHILIIPNRHVDDLSRLSSEERLDWLSLTERVMEALRKTMNAQGMNLGINLGKAGGAGIPKHLHLHIVPRWMGDHNFMPVIGETKVISESLRSVYGTLTKYLRHKKPARPQAHKK